MAQTFEEILQKQQPVSSEVFWQQVEAFKAGEGASKSSLEYRIHAVIEATC